MPEFLGIAPGSGLSEMRSPTFRWLPLALLVIIGIGAAHAGDHPSHGEGTSQAASPAAPPAPTQIWFTRHAQTEANRTGRYTSARMNVFSTEGKKQVEALTKELMGMDFDAIIVSPIPRARNTLLPYLRARGLTAEVWPELAECCHQKDRSAPPSPTMPLGSRIRIDPKDAGVLTLAGSPSKRLYAPANYADGLIQVRALVAALRHRFSGRGVRVLVVGHAINGSRMIEMLCGHKPEGKIRIDNCRLTLLEGDGDVFKLVRLNGRPWKERRAAIARAPGMPPEPSHAVKGPDILR